MCCVGAVFLIVGVGFLTSAGWILLEEAYSSLAASLIIAGIYLGVGLILLAVASNAKESRAYAAEMAPLRDPATAPRPGAMSPLAEAFIIGLNAAYAARRRR